MALRLSRDTSSVLFAAPEILNVTFSLSSVSFLVGVEIALSIGTRWSTGFAPFNYKERKKGNRKAWRSLQLFMSNLIIYDHHN